MSILAGKNRFGMNGVYGSKVMTLTLIISCVCAVLPAQIPSDDLAAYQAAVAQTVLLENDGDLLPLRRLDTLRPVYLNLGMADDAVFRATLNAYLPTGTVYYDQDWEVAPPYRHWGGRPNLLIIGIDAIPSLSHPFSSAAP